MAKKPEKKPPENRTIPKLNMTIDEATRVILERVVEKTGCRSKSAAVAILAREWAERNLGK